VRAALVIFGLLSLTGCAPRESAGPAAPSAGITRELALAFARDTAFTVGGQVVTFTPTGSMLPWLDSRSVAVFESLSANEKVYVGDIVGFYYAGTLISHRVVAVDKKTGLVTTKGTGNFKADAGWHRPTHRLVAVFYTMR